MKVLFSATLILVQVIAGNFLLLQNACRAKSLTEIGESNSNRDKSESPTPTSSVIKWTPSEYSGITPGKTTYKEVIKLLGKPKGESNPEGEIDLDKDSKDFAILLEYPNGENESFDLVLDGKTKIVEYITVYNYIRPTKQEIISKYGDNYFEAASGQSKCVSEKQKRGASEKQSADYPITLIYPEKGIFIPIGKDNKATVISYSYKCSE